MLFCMFLYFIHFVVTLLHYFYNLFASKSNTRVGTGYSYHHSWFYDKFDVKSTSRKFVLKIPAQRDSTTLKVSLAITLYLWRGVIQYWQLPSSTTNLHVCSCIYHLLINVCLKSIDFISGCKYHFYAPTRPLSSLYQLHLFFLVNYIFEIWLKTHLLSKDFFQLTSPFWTLQDPFI